MKTRPLLAQNLICRIALAESIKPKQSNLNVWFEQFENELFPFLWLRENGILELALPVWKILNI